MAKAGKELYVGSLSYDITEYEINKLFSVSGKVTSIHLITDPTTGQFKGCGYVRMSTESEAKDAIDSLDGAWLLDKQITVSYANPQKMKAGGGGAKTLPRWRVEAAEKKAAEKKAAAAANPVAKPAAKPAGKPAASTAAKPAGTRPAAAKAGAARPAGASKPAGSKPASRPGGAAKPGNRTGKR